MNIIKHQKILRHTLRTWSFASSVYKSWLHLWDLMDSSSGHWRPILLCVIPDRELLAGDERFSVPAIIPELSTKRVLTAELIHGMPLDHCTDLPQEVKNEVSSRWCRCHMVIKVLSSDCPECPEFVSKGAVWVSFHADRPKLVKLLLQQRR